MESAPSPLSCRPSGHGARVPGEFEAMEPSEDNGPEDTSRQGVIRATLRVLVAVIALLTFSSGAASALD